MEEIEKAKNKLRDLKSQQRKQKIQKKLDWIGIHKEGLVTATIILMLVFIIFNQVTYTDVDQQIYIGQVKDIGVMWSNDNGITKSGIASLFMIFNDSNKIIFQRYNFNIYEIFEDQPERFDEKYVIVTYEKAGDVRTLLAVMELPYS